MEISLNIICPSCKSVGVIVWDKTGPERTLISLTKNFYERLSKEVPHPIEVVCLVCGTAQLEA